jgi:hypothetical protein
MVELTLEPYAVLQQWSLPVPNIQWNVILADYLQSLARQCQQATGNFLGHIKALAIFPNGGYLRISVVDPQRSPIVEGNVPPGITTLELTLNLIVYGPKNDFLKQIIEKTAGEFASKWNGEVTSQANHHH